MKSALRTLAAPACLIVAILSGCAATDAGARLGTTNAGLTLGALPEDSRFIEPHAPLVEGAEARSVLRRERAALDRANGRVLRCAGYHDDLVARLARR